MNRSRIIPFVISAAIVAFLALRHTGSGFEKIVVSPDPVLSRIIRHADFNVVEAGEVFRILSDQTGTPIIVDWRALETAGINSEAPVTVKLDGLQLSEALPAALTSLGGRTVKLAFTAKGGQINVTTLEQLSGVLVCGLYDVADLIDEIELKEERSSVPPLIVALRRDPSDMASSERIRREQRMVVKSILEGVLGEGRESVFPIERIHPIGDRILIVAPIEDQELMAGYLRDLREHHLPEEFRKQMIYIK